MPSFQYKAIDNRTGQMIKNTVNGVTKQELYKMLKKNGLTPIDIQQALEATALKKQPVKRHRSSEEILRDLSPDQVRLIYNSNSADKKTKSMTSKSKKISKNRNHKITTRDVVIFTQNFLLLKKADFNNIHALETVINSTENPSFKSILEDILAGVESGENMYTTMEYYSHIFPVIYVNMIKVGELSGSLVKSLEQAMEYLETSTALAKRVKKIVMPNVIQFFGMLVLLIGGTIFIIPTIQKVFDQMGSQEELPWMTQKFSEFLKSAANWWFYPVILLVILAIAVVAYIRTPKGRYQWHLFKYKAPIFGPLIYAVDFSRVMKAISLNLKNGMRIQQALEVSKNVAKNNVMLSILETSINNCLIGKSWVEPFEESGFGNAMSTEMLKVGMQTDLPRMMDKLMGFIESDIDAILEKIMKVLPEISYLLVGVVLIFFVCVVLVPCIQVYMGGFMFSSSYM